MPEPTTELAKHGGGLQSFGGGAGRMATSLDIESQTGKRRLLQCLQDCDGRLTEEVNVKLNITDYFAHDVEIVDRKTGEITAATRMVLIDSDGLTHDCVSLTLLRSMQRLEFVFGPLPWNPPRTLTVRSKRKGERNIYWLDCE